MLIPGFPPFSDKSSSARSWKRMVLPSLIIFVSALSTSITLPNWLKFSRVRALGVIDLVTLYSRFERFILFKDVSVSISALTERIKRISL